MDSFEFNKIAGAVLGALVMFVVDATRPVSRPE